VKASTHLSLEQIEKLRDGVELVDGPTKPAIVKHLRESGKYTHIEMTITEGRNRQVRRMLEAIESRVLKLVRVGIGPLAIDGIEIGKWRTLEEEEVAALWAAAGKKS
jgi:23S rRNA pseudouridine2605 synthase